jgi:hypothetical protein
MSEQTAVEWLINVHFGGIENVTFDFRNHIQKAKEMEKQQIEEAWNSAYGGDSNHEGEQYYKETYQDTK